MKKTDLALQYFPYYSTHSAVNRLMSWINYNQELLASLKKKGYRKTQKFFTPAQVEIIYKMLGGKRVRDARVLWQKKYRHVG